MNQEHTTNETISHNKNDTYTSSDIDIVTSDKVLQHTSDKVDKAEETIETNNSQLTNSNSESKAIKSDSNLLLSKDSNVNQGLQEIEDHTTNDDTGNSDGDSDVSETDIGEDEDEDEDEEPPLLIYSRIKQLPIKLFERDAISACNFHDSIFIFGTHSGMLYFTTPHFEMIDTLKCHRSSILSIYTDGVSFATASIDGTIVTGLVNDIKSENLIAYDFKRPINSVVLDTDYVANKTFISGGMAGELILSQRNWLGNKTDITISKGDGPILSINRTEDIIFWFTSSGIHFFDKITKTSLLHVELPELDKNNNPFEIFKPHIHIPERDRIIIGWMDNIWIFKISVATKNTQDGFIHGNVGSIISSAASSFKGIPDKDVDIEYHFVIPLLIAGIASFKDDQLLCLGYEKQFDDKNELQLKHLPPQLQIFNLIDGSEIYNDEIVCKDYEKLSLGDYHLGKHIHENGDSPSEYYLICTSDAIKIQQLTLMDHYNWFIANGKFYNAWNIAQYVVDDIERAKVGIRYIEQLLKEKEFDEVGPAMTRIFKGLGDDKGNEHYKVIDELFNKEWYKVINMYMEDDKLLQIADFIPLTLNRSNSIYDFILNYTLDKYETSMFSKFIQHWPIDLFDSKTIEERLKILQTESGDFEIFYVNQLIYLYLKTEKYSQAIPYMINIKDPKTLRILQNEPQLLPQVMDRLMEIILIPAFNNSKLRNSVVNNLSILELEQTFWEPILLIIQNRKIISLKTVIEQFKDYSRAHENVDKLLLCILLRINSTEPDLLKVYENEMIDLFSRFDKKPLLDFLKNKTHYNIDKAIELCSTQDGLYSELIYLWGKIGETKKALSIIVNKLNDPLLAIEYIRSWGDIELWDFLIEYTMDKPNFVEKLLNSYSYIGNKYINVVEGINDEQPIEKIAPPIIDTLLEVKRSYQVNENVLKIVDDDTSKYAINLLKLRTHGRLCDPNSESTIA